MRVALLPGHKQVFCYRHCQYSRNTGLDHRSRGLDPRSRGLDLRSKDLLVRNFRLRTLGRRSRLRLLCFHMLFHNKGLDPRSKDLLVRNFHLRILERRWFRLHFPHLHMLFHNKGLDRHSTGRCWGSKDLQDYNQL